MTYYQLREADLSPRDWSGFSPRERAVLDCIVGFQVIVYGQRGRKSVAFVASPHRAVMQVMKVRRNGGRAAVYALRHGSTEHWLAHVTLDLIHRLREVDGPPLPPIAGGV
jgi:hypothetical protein